MPPLLDYLVQSLSDLPGTRTLNLHVLVSVPRKYGGLFPYAEKSASPKVYIQDILVLLSEDADIDAQSSKKSRFVSGIEANLFTIPSSSCSILYISKVDSTGQGQSPNPTQTLVKAFLAYFADPTNRVTDTLWIHLFARAQNQYLFPNSIDHPSKRVLSDSKLCLWWKRILGAVAQTQSSASPECYHLLAGLSELEALQLLRETTPLLAPSTIQWIYGHPYSQGMKGMPFGVADSPSIAELIPFFPDDPKSRFLDELYAPAQVLQSMQSPPRKRAKTSHKEEEDQDTRKKHRPPTAVTIDEFWEMMAFRQECASGAVAGFFVLRFNSTGVKPITQLHPEPGQISHNIIERTTSSMLTSHEFSTDQRSFNSTEILETSIRGLCEGLKDPTRTPCESPGADVQPPALHSEPRDWASLEIYEQYIHRSIANCNAPLPVKTLGTTEEGILEAEGVNKASQPVTMLAARKKKKKV